MTDIIMPYGERLKISIITVSYNSERTIKNTLDSVLSQNYPDLEYIIVDGGSNDGTLSIVKSYNNLVDICISEPDQGIYDAMNKGVRSATGEVVGIINSDDFYLNDNVLSEVEAIFASDPEIEVVLGNIDFVDDENLDRPVRTYKSNNFKPWMFRFGFMPPHPATFIKKSAYERVGYYKLGYKIAADFDFLTRLLLLDKAKYKLVCKTWVRMRTGGASTNGLKSNIVTTKEIQRSLAENGVYTNIVFLLFRLPVKLIKQTLFKDS